MENQGIADEGPDRATQVPWQGHFDDLPPGYRFKPSGEELVIHYLIPKLDEKELPPNIIREVELYKYSPDELAETHKPEGRNGDEWYFFTSRERKYRNGHRPKRRAGDGHWKATGHDKEIKVGEEKIGFKKSLVFYRGDPPKGNETSWIMDEFRANRPKRVRPKRVRLNPDDTQPKDWVLCRIYKKSANDKCGDDENETYEHEDENEEVETSEEIHGNAQ